MLARADKRSCWLQTGAPCRPGHASSSLCRGLASDRLANTRDVVLRPQESRIPSRQLINYAAKDTLENTLSGCTPPATLRRLEVASVPVGLQVLPERAHSR